MNKLIKNMSDLNKGYLMGAATAIAVATLIACSMVTVRIRDHQKRMIEYGIGRWVVDTNTFPPEVKFQYIRKNL